MTRSFLNYVLVAAFGAAALSADTTGQALLQDLRNGDVGSVRAAIENGANVETPDEYGNTLLMHVAVFGKVADMEFLLAHGANVNAVNRARHTPLMRAVPDLAKIRLLVEHGANVNAAAADGTTPLMAAAHIRSAADVVRYLVAKGADLHAVDRRGFDPIMIAAEKGAFENLKVLLDAGARGAAKAMNVPGRKGREGTVFAGPVMDLVRRRAEGVTALMNAAQHDCEPCVRLLLEHGADARARTDAGLTALHRAAFHGDMRLVKLLLDAGAPVNVADDRGFTPLMIAVNSRTKNPDVIRMLLDRGADPEAKDASGRTVSQWAAIGANRKMMELLPASAISETANSVARPAEKLMPVREAVEQSITLLEANGPKFFPKAGCISCHNVSIPMMALHEAVRRGFSVDGAMNQMAKQSVAQVAPSQDNLLSGHCSIPGIATTASYTLISLHDAGRPPDLLTDSVVRCLLLEQFPDGRWSDGGGERPPLSPQSGIPGTALAVRTVQLYAPMAFVSQVKAAVAGAQSYLLKARPANGDDHSFRLLGLYWTEANPSKVDGAARDLIAQQRPNGGWAQTPDMDPDAYATGQALAAIAMARPELVSGDAYRRGVDYLLRTREPDGSWHVRSRAFGFQPYFESGFPHGKDQWISMAATAWAAMALMPAMSVGSPR
jgi:ankyrin repeat protein